ncbi:MAG: hypothetical protein ABIO63_03270 [Casimicrobiaceae bacterium]
MKTRSLLIAAAISVAGCMTTTSQPPPERPRETTCSTKTCEIEVIVTDLTASECRISDPGKVNIRTEKDVKITWKIADASWLAGYVFEPKGIVFEKNPKDEFYDADRPTLALGKHFKWHDKNFERGEYKYTIYVKNISPFNGRTCKLDPIIANQG